MKLREYSKCSVSLQAYLRNLVKGLYEYYSNDTNNNVVPKDPSEQ